MNLIISGTNRLGSNSLKVAKYYQHELYIKGESWDILSLEELPRDMLFSDLYGHRSEQFTQIQDKITKSQKFIFIIPEYNGSYPGVLKTFVDACAFPTSFRDKKAILIGVSTGRYGNIRGVDHFTGVCNYMRMHVLPLKIHIPYIQHELKEGEIFSDETTLQFIKEQLDEIVNF